MTVLKNTDNGVLTLKISGRLDSAASGELETATEDAVTEEVEKLVVDMADVDYISSRGIRVLVTLRKALRDKPMTIVNANSSVREIFRMSGLTNVFGVR